MVDEKPREQTAVRLPVTLRAALREIAAANRRSVNAEIQVALEAYVGTASPPAVPASA